MSQDQQQPSRGNIEPSPPHSNTRTAQSGQIGRPLSQSLVRSNTSGHNEEPSDKLTVPIGKEKGMFFDFNEKQAMLEKDLSQLKLPVRSDNSAGKK